MVAEPPDRAELRPRVDLRHDALPGPLLARLLPAPSGGALHARYNQGGGETSKNFFIRKRLGLDEVEMSEREPLISPPPPPLL